MTTFALLIGLGASLGLWQVARTTPDDQTGRWVDAGLGVLVGMLLGARAAYVALHPAYYAAHPGEWYRLWMGGYSAAGAVAGGLLAAGIAATFNQNLLASPVGRYCAAFPTPGGAGMVGLRCSWMRLWTRDGHRLLAGGAGSG